MEILYIAFLLTVIAFLAHIIKGMTGFGPAIVFVSVGSFIYEPITIIVLASLLDIIGGAYLSLLNPEFFNNKEYWLPIGGIMLFGAIIGAVTLFFFPPQLFEYILGIAIIVIAVWFIIGSSEPTKTSKNKDYSIGMTDGAVGLFSGFCGGFTGMGGPPLIIYLGSKLQKEFFRAVIVPIFLMASVARFSSYGVLGMIDISQIVLYIFPPIGVIAGNYIGDKFFESIEQKWFTILIGLILLASGLRLLFV